MKQYLTLTMCIMVLGGISACAEAPILDDEISPSKSTSSLSTSTPTMETDTTVETPVPTEIAETGIPWDLFPGLKNKLEELTVEANCDGLKELEENFADEGGQALTDYIAKQQKTAKCK